jgi:uncharacterized membrane protein YdbT with pleckstrin-like domain
VDPEPGEQVFFHGHPSWRALLDLYFKGLVVVVIAGALAGVISAISSTGVKVEWVVIVVVVGFVLVLGAGALKRLRTTYTITDRRLTIDVGLLSKDLHETRLERVQNVNCSQSLVDRLLRVGAIDFDTAGEAGYDFTFRGVADPRTVVRTVDRAIHQLQRSTSGV